ncbi:hypothetical protein V8C86DRAFT_884558 [Haematococcus lacustris]
MHPNTSVWRSIRRLPTATCSTYAPVATTHFNTAHACAACVSDGVIMCSLIMHAPLPYTTAFPWPGLLRPVSGPANCCIVPPVEPYCHMQLNGKRASHTDTPGYLSLKAAVTCASAAEASPRDCDQGPSCIWPGCRPGRPCLLQHPLALCAAAAAASAFILEKVRAHVHGRALPAPYPTVRPPGCVSMKACAPASDAAPTARQLPACHSA